MYTEVGDITELFYFQRALIKGTVEILASVFIYQSADIRLLLSKSIWGGGGGVGQRRKIPLYCLINEVWLNLES